MKKTFTLLSILVVGFAAYLLWRELSPNTSLNQQADIFSDGENTREQSSQTYQFNAPTNEIATTQEGATVPSVIDTAPAMDLPALDKSDKHFYLELGKLTPISLSELIVKKALIRHIVITVDNVPTAKLPNKYLFFTPAKGSFIVQALDKNTFSESPANASRYDAHMQWFNATDLPKAVKLYQNYYPLFQQAYEELGYPEQQFNDRLLEVIRHLLQTPEPIEPLRLKQPKVAYTFVQPEFESLSSGQKILLRIGAENRQRVKQKLIELTKLLTES
jgi:Protein of unknown function (DUF3014)